MFTVGRDEKVIRDHIRSHGRKMSDWTRLTCGVEGTFRWRKSSEAWLAPSHCRFERLTVRPTALPGDNYHRRRPAHAAALVCRMNAQPTAMVIDSRTLRSTRESGARAGYDTAKRRKNAKVHAAVNRQTTHERRTPTLPGSATREDVTPGFALRRTLPAWPHLKPPTRDFSNAENWGVFS